MARQSETRPEPAGTPSARSVSAPANPEHASKAARAAAAAAAAQKAAKAGKTRTQQVGAQVKAGGSLPAVARPIPAPATRAAPAARAAPAGPASSPPLPGAKPAASGSRPMSKPASPSYWRFRHFVIFLSFCLFVLAPSAAAGFYLYTIAADQYASKVGFTVRREDSSSAFDVLGSLSNMSSASSSDTDILYEFIQSQKLVSDIDRRLDLRAMWSKPIPVTDEPFDWRKTLSEFDWREALAEFDWREVLTKPDDPAPDIYFAIDKDASLEELVHYWNSMVRISYESGSGLIEVQVLAFASEDATAISQALFDESSQMINDLSDIARQDAIQYSREELDTVIGRLKEARAIVTRFRNLHQIVDPKIDIQTQAGLIGNLQTQKAQTLIEIDLLQGARISTSDPRLVQAQRRFQVIENRINAEREKLGVGGRGANGTAFADLLGDYERLVVDREFAEKSYVTALAGYDAAQADARRKTRYLAAYMQPTVAETPEYPKRFTLLALLTLFLFLIWSVVVLVLSAIRDRS